MKIQEVLEELNIEYMEAHATPHVRDGWVGITCPHCDRGARNYGLGINLQSGGVSCWKCGTHRLIDILHDISGKAYEELKELLKDWQQRPTDYKKVTCGVYTPPEGIGELQPCHSIYLKSRGFEPAEIKKLWGVEGIGQTTRFNWCLFIPIIYQGEAVSWIVRSISDRSHVRRYTGASPLEEKYHYKDLLYGEDYCRQAVCVLEGPTDVWAVGPGAVCTFGLGYTRAQVARISNYPVRIIVFDNEPTAQMRARQLAAEVEAFPGQTIRVALESGKDAAEANRKEIKDLRKLLT